jgi:hypothetical protein
MKNITAFLIAIALIVTSFSSCKKSDGGTTTYAATQGRVTATGGLTFDVTGASTTFTRKTTTTVDSIYIGGATSLTTSSVTGAGFVLRNINTPGTYSLAGSNASQNAIAGYYAGTANADTYISTLTSVGPGTITISAISTTAIEGTYTTKVTNFLGTAISFSGTFKGNF